MERATGRALGLQVIGAMKLASALLLGVAGFGIFRLMNEDWGEALEHLVVRLHLDPDDRIGDFSPIPTGFRRSQKRGSNVKSTLLRVISTLQFAWYFLPKGGHHDCGPEARLVQPGGRRRQCHRQSWP